MNLSEKYELWNTEDDLNWDVIEISKVTNKIIKNLVENLKRDLSNNFYISFESLIKIGRKKNIKPIVESYIKTMINGDWRKDLFKFILKYINNKDIKNPLIFQLYNPDFIKRARAIMQVQHAGALNYSKVILSLMDDPDDSVRWAALNFFISLDQLNNSEFQNKLKSRINKEINQTIQKKIFQILYGIQIKMKN
ncbi:MAG: hypothetical protein ACFFBP_19845 [Promethearchaeota archaeon]